MRPTHWRFRPPILKQTRSTRSQSCRMNSLVRIAIQNATAKVLSLGIGGEQLLILLNGNAPVAIDLATAELQIELLPVAIVCDRGQHLRLDQHPVHTLGS